MFNFEWLLTRVKEQYLENHLRHEELALISIELHHYLLNLLTFFLIPAVSYSGDSLKNTNNFTNTKQFKFF
jgi:hypothetical protein